MTLSTRIKMRRKALGLTQAELAQLVGTTQQNIGKLEKEGSSKTTLIIRLSIALKCEAKWLEFGDGTMTNETVKKKDSFIINYLQLPSINSNNFHHSDITQIVKVIEYDIEQAKTLFDGLISANLKIINLSSDSMQGTFESGETLFVDISKNRFVGDGIYVFSFGCHVFVKRLQMLKNTLIVLSDNKAYRDWEISEDELEQLAIYGKVMLSQSMSLKKHG